MGRKLLDELGALQRAVMERLWSMGEGTVHEIRGTLGTGEAGNGGRGSRPAYTTVLSVLQKLEKAGWVQHRADGRTYVYRPARTREQEGSSSIRGFVDRVFGGDPMKLFQHLLEHDRLDEADLAALRELIDRQRKERGDA